MLTKKSMMMILRIILIIVLCVMLTLILSWIGFNIMNLVLVLKNMIIISYNNWRNVRNKHKQMMLY
jgi:hypothetical protein